MLHAHLGHDRRVGHEYPIFWSNAIETYTALVRPPIPMAVKPHLDPSVEKNIHVIRLASPKGCPFPPQYIKQVFREERSIQTVNEAVVILRGYRVQYHSPNAGSQMEADSFCEAASVFEAHSTFHPQCSSIPHDV